ncbi:uncharacterized protein LOC129918170 [Episyrphus balteatus]|uniref:uncharacterized protein LOC129918170 n=1 Tax=Episyrphus balteatus TaxID=286459 RepID=UPI0024868618|nr:uncharacterized protein LOC129918170 [Episyrphus balteatus]
MDSINTNDTISNPNDNLKIPDWIYNESLFLDILKENIPEFSNILKFTPLAAIGPGENYTSTMIRIHIHVQLKDGKIIKTSYIAKTAIESDLTQEMVNALNVFPKEREMYEKILPKYEELFAEAGIEAVRFGPSCKFIKDPGSDNIAMIMEDLKLRNFSNVDRFEGLDMDHMICALKKLAEFHAASAVYNERFGPFSDILRNTLNTEDKRDMFKQFGAGLDKAFIEIIPEWGECEKYIPIWPDADKLFDWFLKATVADPTEFNVLNHGDCWSNNIMFQHDQNGQVTETYFIDYQITQWGTPAEDIYFLITVSAQFDLKIKEFDRFLKIYQEHLAKTLKLLNYQSPIPSLKDIHMIMIKYSLWSFYSATSFLSLILSKPDENASVDNLTVDTEEGKAFRRQILTNPKYVKAMKEFLPWWENRGVFEIDTKMAPGCKTETAIVNPNANLIIPNWINEELFEKIVKKDFPNFSKILNFTATAALGVGENYASRIIRTHIDIQLKDGSTVQTSYVIKTGAESESTRTYVDSIYGFPKDREILEDIYPKFTQLYAKVGKKIQFGPNCKYVLETPGYMSLVMDDLRRLNFTNVNRLEGMDMEHMKCVLVKLGALHAASAVYYERFGPFSENLNHSLFIEKYRDTFKSFGSGSATMFQNILPKWGGCEKYISMWPNPDKLFDWYKKATTPDPNEFNVLNHGDCWVNNIMFEHNKNGNVTDTYFIDYQLTCYGNPAQDLYYFITASASYDLRVKEFDYFLRVYHESLVENLKLLNYQNFIPTLKDIHYYMIKYSLWSFWVGTSIMTVVLADGNAGKGDMESLMVESEENNQLKMNPRYVKFMKQLLPWWENRGMFEF